MATYGGNHFIAVYWRSVSEAFSRLFLSACAHLHVCLQGFYYEVCVFKCPFKWAECLIAVTLRRNRLSAVYSNRSLSHTDLDFIALFMLWWSTCMCVFSHVCLSRFVSCQHTLPPPLTLFLSTCSHSTVLHCSFQSDILSNRTTCKRFPSLSYRNVHMSISMRCFRTF